MAIRRSCWDYDVKKSWKRIFYNFSLQLPVYRAGKCRTTTNMYHGFEICCSGHKFMTLYIHTEFQNFILQNVWMKGIQNKIFISQKTIIIHIYGLHHYKGKPSKFVSEYITRQISRRYATSFHVAWSIFGVTVATVSLLRAFRCWRSLILTW
jgi:hypothetical protein